MNQQLRPGEIEAKADAEAGKPIVSVRDLKIQFKRPSGELYSVVDGVSFDILAGEIVGIVGESGSGKSLTARSILRLVPKGGMVSGGATFQGIEIGELSEAELQKLRGGEIAMVFQDAMTSFNPVLKVGEQIEETIVLHDKSKRGRTAKDLVVSLLTRVGITNPAQRAKSYPHEFSGGMRQRALTAMALANDPVLLVADEPTTALDVTVQDQVMELFRDLNRRGGTAILLITHNIAVVASLCTRVIVMYAGRIVEDGPVEQVLTDPQHPYTWSLLKSVPRLEKSEGRLVAIDGQPPDPQAMPTGCKFSPRCPFSIARCSEAEPVLEEVTPGHNARCWVKMSNVEART
jgi:peptide/nickel transport system ATP-binding protein